MFVPDLRFLEGDEDEDTCMISQEDIAEAVDITSGAKVLRPFYQLLCECVNNLLNRKICTEILKKHRLWAFVWFC